jgi:ribose 1,5-bisphosphokinase PhnN
VKTISSTSSADEISKALLHYFESPKNGYIVVGHSGSGKSLFISYLREFANKYDPESVYLPLDFPRRVTTRPARQDDSPEDTRSIGKTEFVRMEEAKEFILTWEKRISDSHVERYAIESPTANVFPVISGNNALAEFIWRSGEARNFIIVNMVTQRSIREARISERSPESLKGDEGIYRLDGPDAPSAAVSLQIDNSGSQTELRSLAERFVVAHYLVTSSTAV